MDYEYTTFTVLKQGPDTRRKVASIKCPVCHTEPVMHEGQTCDSCVASQLNAKYEQEQERICSSFVICPECHRMPARIGDICGRCKGKRRQQHALHR